VLRLFALLDLAHCDQDVVFESLKFLVEFILLDVVGEVLALLLLLWEQKLL
jgi:hypothetical protein